jgi:hypothetical protein
MSNDYPVRIDPISPPRFDRIQLVLRVAIAVVLGWLGVQGGWLACVAFAILPLIAAVAISSVGSERYLRDVAPPLWRVLDWLLRLSAYMSLVVDRFPAGDSSDILIELRCTGRPTIGSALARFATSIPSGLVLIALGCVGSVLWIVAAVIVAVGRPLPGAILGFQRGVLRWQGRLLAYHASLVAEYPPWSFDTEACNAAPLAMAGVR